MEQLTPEGVFFVAISSSWINVQSLCQQTHIVLYPPRFPEAFPCNVSIDGKVAVEYLLLRTKEILDDGTIVITNYEQKDFNFKVIISINPTSHQVSFSVAPTNPTNYESLQYRKFLKKASTAQKIVVKALDKNIEILSSGKLHPIDFARLDDEIEFLEKIVCIESFWNTTLCIPPEIRLEDHLLINRLYSIIKDGAYQGNGSSFDFTLEVSDILRESINNSTPDEIYSLAYTDDVTVSLFNQTIKFPLLRRIDGAKLGNLKELKKEISCLNNGEKIELKYIPAKQGERITYYDAFYSEEAEQKLLHAQVV